MGYFLPTKAFATVKSYAKAFVRSSFPGLPAGESQFLGQLARAIAMQAWGSQKAAEDISLDVVPQLQSSKAGLSAWAVDLGLPNGAGGYGPLVAQPASGGVATLTGVLGTTFADGTLATAPDGTTQVKVSGTVSIPGSPPGTGSVTAKIVAVTAGSVGNFPAGSQFTWNSPPSGADATFTLSTGLSNGTDVESNPAIYARIVSQIQNPRRGGTAADYRAWGVPANSGIVFVYVYPRRSGTGTVDLVIVVAGSPSGTGAERVPSAALQATVQAAVDAARPVACDAANVLVPSLASSGHLVRVRVIPNGAANAFDWGQDVPGTAFIVDAYSAGPPATIRLTGLAPTSLKNAIANYVAGTGTQPRLQVLSSGGPAVNPPVGTSKTVTWSDAGGKTTITLDTAPTGWQAPTSGDTVYPYGPVVATIAAGELALVQSIGPSRASGLGDALTTWNDWLYVSDLIDIARNAVDANGNPLILEVPVGGATIDGSAVDLEAQDNTPSAPELLYASHIAVTQ